MLAGGVAYMGGVIDGPELVLDGGDKSAGSKVGGGRNSVSSEEGEKITCHELLLYYNQTDQ
jgi:hypothetical protein